MNTYADTINHSQSLGYNHNQYNKHNNNAVNIN